MVESLWKYEHGKGNQNSASKHIKVVEVTLRADAICIKNGYMAHNVEKRGRGGRE